MSSDAAHPIGNRHNHRGCSAGSRADRRTSPDASSPWKPASDRPCTGAARGTDSGSMSSSSLPLAVVGREFEESMTAMLRGRGKEGPEKRDVGDLYPVEDSGSVERAEKEQIGATVKAGDFFSPCRRGGVDAQSQGK